MCHAVSPFGDGAARRGHRHRSGIALLVLLAGAPHGAARGEEDFVKPREGFLSRDILSFSPGAFLGGIAYSPGGDPITYENQTGEIQVHEGESPRALTRFEPSVFGSFLVPHPDGVSIVFAESSAGNVYRVPYSGEGRVLLDTIPFAYDLAFDARGRGFVSSHEGTPRVVLLDADPLLADREVISAFPQGYSGPLAFDASGNLFYGTAHSEGPQQLVRFAPGAIEAAIQGETAILFEDGEVILDDMDGFFSLRWRGGRLYFTDLGFSSGRGALQVIDPAANFEVSILALFETPEGILSPGYIAFREGSLPFEAGSGPEGGSLMVSYSNFTTVNRIAEITPELWFVRGRVNDDEEVDIADAIFILEFLFSGGPPPRIAEALNVDDKGEVDLADAIFLLGYLFLGGPVIPEPFPDAGPDPTP